MPMTVKVGLAKKVGQPDFGSLGASCDIELELDGSLLFHDLDGLQEKVRAAYVACRQAVNDELANQTRPKQTTEPAISCTPAETNAHRLSAPNGHLPQNGSGNRSPRTNEHRNAQSTSSKRRGATTSQVRALHAIATRQGFNLTDRLKDQFQLYRAEDLSVSEASRLIDDLNTKSVPVDSHGFGGHA